MSSPITLYRKWEGWNFGPLGEVTTYHPLAQFRKVRFCVTHLGVESNRRGECWYGSEFAPDDFCVIEDKMVEV